MPVTYEDSHAMYFIATWPQDTQRHGSIEIVIAKDVDGSWRVSAYDFLTGWVSYMHTSHATQRGAEQRARNIAKLVERRCNVTLTLVSERINAPQDDIL